MEEETPRTPEQQELRWQAIETAAKHVAEKAAREGFNALEKEVVDRSLHAGYSATGHFESREERSRFSRRMWVAFKASVAAHRSEDD